MLTSDFFVYIHTDLVGRAFYIGKGNGRRHLAQCGRSASWRNYVSMIGGYLPRKVEFFALESEALLREAELIDLARSMGGKLVNICRGGKGTAGFRHTDATKAAMSAARAGKPRSEETKKKVADALTGRKRPAMTEAWKAAISASNSGRVRSEAHRQNLSAALKGRKVSEETRQKMSQRQMTEETRAKISAAVRKAIERKRSGQ